MQARDSVRHSSRVPAAVQGRLGEERKGAGPPGHACAFSLPLSLDIAVPLACYPCLVLDVCASFLCFSLLVASHVCVPEPVARCRDFTCVMRVREIAGSRPFRSNSMRLFSSIYSCLCLWSGLFVMRWEGPVSLRSQRPKMQRTDDPTQCRVLRQPCTPPRVLHFK